MIAGFILTLGDPSYAKRTEATRRICAIGMPAAERLKAAAKGDDMEVALRAKAILRVLDSLMFSGVEIRLAFSKPRIVWNDSVDLIITLTNRSKYPARIPFELDPAKQNQVESDARQVADLIDAAELLRVRRANGDRIELTLDDITADRDVADVVQRRVDVGPISVLAPGQRVTITARALNRGWARYRLLDADVYTVSFEYVPRWDDELLAAERVGRVTGNESTLTVTEGAPETVSRRGPVASLHLDREGAFLVARLTNRFDHTVIVNTNFGRSPPFAQAQWVYEFAGAHRDVPVEGKPALSWHDFDVAGLVSVSAGETVELARTRIDELRRALAGGGAVLANDDWTLHFAYDNLCDRTWQERQGSALIGNAAAPSVFQKPLPRRMLSTRQTSNRLSGPSVE